jgi:hypothetical protein
MWQKEGSSQEVSEPCSVDDLILKHPFTALIAGPTGSGKTEFLTSLLINFKKTIDSPIQRLVYCYGVFLKETFDVLKLTFPFLELINGLPEDLDFDRGVNNFLILDDLMNDGLNSDIVCNLFSRGSHHLNLSVILISQNLFHQGKNSRTISRNCHYIIYFKNPRDVAQIEHFARQMYPKKSGVLLEACQDATAKPYGYLLIDLRQETKDDCRLRTNVLPSAQEEFVTVYLPK